MTYILAGLLIIIIILWIITRLWMKVEASMILDILFLVTVFLLSASIVNIYDILNSQLFTTYISTVKSMIEILLLSFVILIFGYIVVGFSGKKYSLRIENFNIGGINVFFDKSNEIFIKTVGSFIASKRSLFKFNKKRDNISEVLNAYYETYKYIKDNLELLDIKKDEELYSLSVEMLKKLNHFLSTHQNDYRRWYDRIYAEDRINVPDNKSIVVHETTIEVIQEHYYRYAELLKDIEEINQYFSKDKIKIPFKINYFNWSEELDA